MTSTLAPPAAEASPAASDRTRPAPAPRAAGGIRIPARRWVLDLVATALLIGVSIAGWWPTFDGPGFLAASIGALALGLGVAALCAWRRWGILITAGLTIAVYFVFGAALALPQTAALGVVPTLDSLTQLAVGVVTSWKQLLTTVPPVAAADGFLLVPFLLTLTATVVTASLALRLRRPAWALLPASVTLIVQIVFSMPEPAFPIVQGVVFAVTALGWLAIRQAWAPADDQVVLSDASAVSGAGGMRLLSGLLVVAVASGAGIAATAFAAPDEPRQVLRQVIIPPFDVQQYPSPLQSFRKQVRDDKKTALFTVTGLPKDGRVRLATMDAYSGVVYNVAAAGTSASGSFTPLRTNMSQGASGEAATLHFTVEALDGVWMPDAGWVHSVTFGGADADTLRRAGNYNEQSGTAVVTTSLTKGDQYTLQTTIAGKPDPGTLKKDAFAPLTLPKPVDVPQAVIDKGASIVSKARTPYEQAQALADYLHKNGFFSHGLRGEGVPSLAGHGSARIGAMLDGDQMVGDDEQYAVLMALMARSLGMPVRVVMGYYPASGAASSPFTATGDDLHAWVEVAFQNSGWVAFDPTPPKDRIATAQKPKPKPKPKPQVPQPPPPVQQPADDSPTVQNDKGVDHKNNHFLAILGPILAIGGGVLGLAAVLLAPFLIIGAMKAKRRRKRKDAADPADRISGGWDELVDRASDYGARVPRGATRVEDAAVLAAATDDAAVATLAVRADSQVFGPSDPSQVEVAEFWRQVDEIVAGLGTRASLWRRLRARLSLRAYLADSRMSRATRKLVDTARSAGADAVRSVSGTARDTEHRGRIRDKKKENGA